MNWKSTVVVVVCSLPVEIYDLRKWRGSNCLYWCHRQKMILFSSQHRYPNYVRSFSKTNVIHTALLHWEANFSSPFSVITFIFSYVWISNRRCKKSLFRTAHLSGYNSRQNVHRNDFFTPPLTTFIHVHSYNLRRYVIGLSNFSSCLLLIERKKDNTSCDISCTMKNHFRFDIQKPSNDSRYYYCRFTPNYGICTPLFTTSTCNPSG